MSSLTRVLATSLLSVGLLLASGSMSDAVGKPRPTRSSHPASQRTKPASGAQRRQTWHNTGSDLKGRFRALGHQFHRSK